MKRTQPELDAFNEGNYKAFLIAALQSIDWALPSLRSWSEEGEAAHVFKVSIPSCTGKRLRHFAVYTETRTRRIVFQEFASEAKLRKARMI
jgi:hypothetical protein